MSMLLPKTEIEYPESDGQPMADNTLQWEWIVTIKNGLEELFRDRDDVFIASDLLWYPVEGQPTIRYAPDVMVAFGRPKGHRRSYLQWNEGSIPPQVVFEILSPHNTPGEMSRKLAAYERYGPQEYYLYDPDKQTLKAWQRIDEGFQEIDPVQGWVSPLLQVRFEIGPDGLQMTGPDGERIVNYLESQSRYRDQVQRANTLAEEMQLIAEQRDWERLRVEELYYSVNEERQRTEQERNRAEQERRRAEALAAKLRELGINPEELGE